MAKLFLDDIRVPPDKSWLVVKTAEEAIAELEKGHITFASLDHDLVDGHYPWNTSHPYPPNEILIENTGAMTGLNVVMWMRANNVWPVDGVKVHSQNDIGKERMLKIITEHYHD